MSERVTPVETIVAVLGHPVAGNPMQFAMETAASAAHVNLRVFSFDVPQDQQQAALDALAVLGVTGVVLQGDPGSPARILHRPSNAWADTGLVASTGRLLLTAFGRDECAAALALGDHAVAGRAIDLDAESSNSKLASAASGDVGRDQGAVAASAGEGLTRDDDAAADKPSMGEEAASETSNESTPVESAEMPDEDAPEDSRGAANAAKAWPHDLIVCPDWSSVTSYSDIELVLLSSGVDHEGIPKEVMNWLSKEKPVLLSWNGNWQSESFFSIRRLADSAGCPFVSRIGWHAALLAAAIDSWTHQAVSAEVLSDAMEEYLAV
ncbi:MAG: hypothetical protein AAGD07_18855 [Planctomycetota bacterium]